MAAAADFLFPGSQEPICPYPGLRTFTEEESIYFRGRESHVSKCLRLLAQEHFVMVTGASGDGKSSLVFAGMLPEIRAGFFRAKYSNWVVATFRPERNPLRNLAHTLTQALRLENGTAAVETELSQGFSALVQLYQASSLCPPAAARATSEEQRRHQHEAANLLLVVDQFEEFFTNAENYDGNTANTAAQTVVNLLIETTRLARQQGLPIYILCTMRSDYVGQCAEFRGLIELIGESQYFVPRLLRHEFVEVIKEPALLSGNRISERLVQRLLYDIQDGQDQLPVLQHALYQIWVAADCGRQEMDLRHYAQVGGMALEELPTADQAEMRVWLAEQDEQQRQLLQQRPSLHNVLDAHANKLYYGAAGDYNRRHPRTPISEATAQRVLETTFRCLTRLDANRVVRNRMTGAEVTAIINDPALPWPVVCQILMPFRRLGNTFIYPFLTEADEESTALPAETVLDITHESLIRNWTRLTEWAHDEAKQVTTFQEVQAQALRWQENERSAGFLLPIGLYTHFASWFARKQPSVGWLAHYVGVESGEVTRSQVAEERLQGLRRFLEVSRRKLRFPLFLERYGVGKIIGFVALLITVLALIFGYNYWRVRQPDYVAYQAVQDHLPDLTSRYITTEQKADFVIGIDRLQSFLYKPLFSFHSQQEYQFINVLDNLHDDTLAIDIELDMMKKLITTDADGLPVINPMAKAVTLDIHKRIQQFAPATAPLDRWREMSLRVSIFINGCEFYTTHTPDSTVTSLRGQYIKWINHYVQKEINSNELTKPDPITFGYCLRTLISKTDSTVSLNYLEQINPFASSSSYNRFKHFFPRRGVVKFSLDSQIGHSGGYMASAIICIALRDEQGFIQSLDSIKSNSVALRYKDSHFAIPYLVKYNSINNENLTDIIQRIADLSDTDFYTSYSILLYKLISISTSKNVFYVTTKEWDGLVYAENVNTDLYTATSTLNHEKTWSACLSFANHSAGLGSVFTNELAKHDTEISEQFIKAFTYKINSIYLANSRNNIERADSMWNAHMNIINYYHMSFANYTISQHLNMDGTKGYPNGKEHVNAFDFLLTTRPPVTKYYDGTLTLDYNFYIKQNNKYKSMLNYYMQATTVYDSIASLETTLPGKMCTPLIFDNYFYFALHTDRWSKPDTATLYQIAKFNDQNQAFLKLNKLAYYSNTIPNNSVVQRLVNTIARNKVIRSKSIHGQAIRLLLSDLAVKYAKHNHYDQLQYFIDPLPEAIKRLTYLRVYETALFNHHTSEKTSFNKFLSSYIQEYENKPEMVASSIIGLFSAKWSQSDSTQGAQEAFLQQTIKEGSSRIARLDYLIAGRVLGGNSYQAYQEIPTYLPSNNVLALINTLLHANAAQVLLHASQQEQLYWKVYQEDMLTGWHDYSGSVKADL
ncbi:ATP-binding protein [Hymenobacter sp. BT175]|uniref:nSTAND1 domain-containing NTPase n=1 Tax=Hymenobacter translucens TaxID=2886507 RepID=UPI001D0F166C|nr:ATP-binding protein [Hymenobacter translucens]MCC2548693.1 ATP-binding protein [Hymenobacter translucens]